VTIALDASPLAVPTGGVARYTWELARSLAENYPHDDYWLLSDQRVEIPAGRPANLHLGQAPANPLERRWWLWGVEREMQRRAVDVFHGTDFAVPYLARRPAVMTLHDLSPWMDRAWQADTRVRRRTPVLLRRGLAHMVITPSEAIRRQAMEHFGLEAKRVVATPLGVSEAFRPCKGNPPERPYFLFVGTLEPRKGIGPLIEAWRETRRRCAVDLVIAGRRRGDFHAPPPEPGLHVLGAVPDQDLPGLYSGALACVYPSLYEGFGLPVLEAMRCGALVITSDDPAVMEVTGGHALHVKPEASLLSEALEGVFRSAERFEGLRRRGVERAARFTWRETARRTREVYDAAVRVFKRG
jgi:glycosyltransferase involved in cell wall biosynthesis